MFIKKNVLYDDWSVLIKVALTLCIIGLLFVYSASCVYAAQQFGYGHYFFKKQCIGLLLGCIAFFLARMLSLHTLYVLTPLFFAGAYGLTLATLFKPFGITIHGSSRWFAVPGFSFQPSDLLKVAFILYIARILTKKKSGDFSVKHTYLPFLVVTLLTALLLLKQPDFGLTVTLCSTALCMLFIAELPLKYLFLIIGSCIPILAGLIYAFPYRLARITTFLHPWKDPQGAGFQIIQSLIAIGSGNWFGSGIAHSKQKFFYLPMQHTDFIFSIIAEETGFIGVCIIIVLFILFLYKGIKIAWQLRNPFCTFATLGFIILLSLQALINIFVTSGLAPTKGIGLPFISYGNSSLMCTLLMLGIIASMVDHST